MYRKPRRVSTLTTIEYDKLIAEHGKSLELRREARRQRNFTERDRIKHLLEDQGVPVVEIDLYEQPLR